MIGSARFSVPELSLLSVTKKRKLLTSDTKVKIFLGVHLTDEYKKTINRFKKVPALVDNDFQLSESVAMIRYLTAKHKTLAEKWYPEDLQTRGRIDEYLEWQHSNTRATCMHYFILKYLKPRVAGKSPDDDRIIASAEKQMEESLNMIEDLWLEPNSFIAGKNISFADILAACELEQPSMFSYKHKFVFFLQFLSKNDTIFCFEGIAGFEPGVGRPKLTAWMQAVKELTNPYYDEAHQYAYKVGSESRNAVNMI